MLKRILIPLFLFSLVLSVNTFAQPKPEPPAKEEILTHLTKKLGLNDEQVGSIDKILSATRVKLDAIHEKMEKPNKELFEEEKNILDDVDKKIEKNLNETQKRIFAEMKKERQKRSKLPPPLPGK